MEALINRSGIYQGLRSSRIPAGVSRCFETRLYRPHPRARKVSCELTLLQNQ